MSASSGPYSFRKCGDTTVIMAAPSSIEPTVRIEAGGEPGRWLRNGLILGLLVAFFYSVASALFLADFDMRRLPEAYIYAGALGFVVVQGFSRLERRWPLGRLLVVNLVFLILLVAAFRWGIVATDARWLSFALFLWIDPVLTLAQLGFWGLAGRLFDLQQSKRLFGLVGSGEVVAEILGFLLVPVLIRVVRSPSDLLVLAVVGLGGSLVVLSVLLRRFGGTLERRPAEGAPEETPEEPQPQDRATLRGRYTGLLAASAAVLVVVVYFLDFGFLSVVDRQLEGDAVQLASFLGVFWGVTELAELLFKLAASGRLLRTFGMLFGLLAYPLAVLGTMALAVAAASLLGTESLPFFVLVVLAKLVGFVLQRSLFEPSSRVLFQPLPEELRFAAQARIEGGVKQAALVAAGLLLLLVARAPSLGLAQVVQILLFLLLGWSALLVLIHREYRAKLMQALAGTAGISGIILFIIIGATTFAQILTFSGATNGLVDAIKGAQLAPWLVLGATMLFMIQRPLVRWLRRHAAAEPQSDAERTRRWPPTSILVYQFFVAIYGGYFGAGVGILMLAVLGFMGLSNIHRMNGLKNWGGLCMNAVAAGVFAWQAVNATSSSRAQFVGASDATHLASAPPIVKRLKM